LGGRGGGFVGGRGGRCFWYLLVGFFPCWVYTNVLVVRLFENLMP